MACGITYTIGSVNFLFDPTQRPHLRGSDRCALFDVSQSAGAAKSPEIMRLFDIVSSPAITEALERGTGRIEAHVLLLSYRHLSPLANLVRSRSKGVEKGDTYLARPQPPPDRSPSIINEDFRSWCHFIGGAAMPPSTNNLRADAGE